MRAEGELQHQDDRFELLLNLTTQITSSLDLREVLRAVAANIREVIHADAVVVSLPDTASGKFKIFAVDFPHGKGVLKEELLVTPSAAVKKAIETLKPVLFDRCEPDDFDIVAAEGLRALCNIPLVNRGRALGILSLLRTTETPFTPEDVDFLTRTSGPIAIAVENALAFREVSSLGARLQLLLNLTNRITSNLEFREVLRAIAANIREVIQADAVTVALPDPVSDQFKVFAMDFPHGKGVIKEELLVTPGAAIKKAIESLKPVLFDTRDHDELEPDPYGLAAAEGLKAACNIPLVNRDRALGILSILRTTETAFTSEDVDFLSRASGPIAIAIENALAYREISELKDKLAQEKLYLEEEFRSEMGFEQIIGNSEALKHVLQQVETVALSDSTVLLLGETGTGKELIARAIHDRSRRKQRTLVKLNCAAIPTGLLESELFGHEKGAFTGAISQKIGRLELADQGTLFLDEVGDIPIEIQPKLLRALQEREFERLGSTHTRKVNVRLVAATNRDLEKMIANKEFRSDLYYRLNVFPIRIPPLRDRREDIPLLVSNFVQKFAKQMQKPIEAIPTSIMKGLRNWDWPGNIRELENFLERAVLLTRGKTLEAPLAELRKTNTEGAAYTDLDEVKQVARERTNSRGDKSSVADEYARKQRDEIVRALAACKGHVGGPGGAAARLGINRTTLLSRMKKLGIYAKQYA
ncbi:MAG TPA: sigma 54-interacting transcriptional regulator [Candidatus Acidoferrum sp.]|nr:sigma 54-interacting transcriptional regulator [Candidatus Acidoferrum sp.]